MSTRTRMPGILLVVGALELGLAASGAAEEPLYRFVDPRGVVHLTNVPNDRRFELISVKPTGVVVHRRRARVRPRRHSRAFDAMIVQAGRAHGVPPALIKAVMATESSFDPQAISHKGAMGLMQLMPQTAARLGVRDPFRPEENVHGGTRYLRGLKDRYRDWILALAAYNAGPQAVDRYGGVPPFRETRQYVRRIIHYYRRYYDEFL